MGKKGDEFKAKLKNLPAWVVICLLAAAFVVTPLLTLTIIFRSWKGLYALVAWLFVGLFALCGIFSIVDLILKGRRKAIKVVDRYAFTRNLRTNFNFRTMVFGVGSLLFNTAYTLFLMIAAFKYRSVWYGMVGIYYILLSVARGGVLIQNRRDEKELSGFALQEAKAGTYRYCAVMMLVVATAFVYPVAELVIRGPVRQSAWPIYVFSAVAGYRIFNAICNFIKATKRDDLVVRSVRYINLAVALMTVLNLQIAVLAVAPLDENVVALCNGLTGGFVCAVAFALGGYMLVYSSKVKKRLLAQRIALGHEGEEYNREGYREEYSAIYEKKENRTK